jgi:hypothetical protein
MSYEAYDSNMSWPVLRHTVPSYSWKDQRASGIVPRFGGQSPACHRTGLGSIPDRAIWDMLWKKLWWDRLFSQYFGFHLSISFHQCSIRIHLPPTPDKLSNWQRRWTEHLREPGKLSVVTDSTPAVVRLAHLPNGQYNAVLPTIVRSVELGPTRQKYGSHASQ